MFAPFRPGRLTGQTGLSLEKRRGEECCHKASGPGYSGPATPARDRSARRGRPGRQQEEIGASRCVMKCHVPSWPIAIRGDGGAVRPRAAGPGRGKPHTEAAACSCNVHIADVKAFPAPAATHFEIAGHGAAPGAARVLLSRKSETPLPQYPSRVAPDACPGPRSGERHAIRKGPPALPARHRFTSATPRTATAMPASASGPRVSPNSSQAKKATKAGTR